jgi:UDPglucose--hexose-1-phosphate uridylyltransferase
MSEVRFDPLSDAWVIMAPTREMRPEELVEAQLPGPPVLPCPFCAGNERQTPNPTLVITEPGSRDQENWLVRVVPNKFSAVEQSSTGPSTSSNDRGLSSRLSDLPPDLAVFSGMSGSDTDDPPLDALNQGPLSGTTFPNQGSNERHTGRSLRGRRAPSARTPAARASAAGQPPPRSSQACFRPQALTGGHEVIIESPLHVQSLSDLDHDQVTRVFESYRQRLAYWLTKPDVEYAIVFKNVGAAAGASLRHSHSQLIATSLLPPSVRSVGLSLAEHHANHGACLACEIIEEEIQMRQRVVALTQNFAAICPFASRLPYSIRVFPRQHRSDFHELPRHELEEFAELVQQLVKLLETLHVPAAYNYIIQTRARSTPGPAAFHWYLEIFPRLIKQAGFEWGSGGYINTVLPEAAASHLRSVLRRLRTGDRRRGALSRNSAPS